MKIKSKLLLGIGGMIALMLVADAFSYSYSKQAQNGYDRIIQNEEVLRFDMKAIQFRLAGISNDERGYLLTGDGQFPQELQGKEKEVDQYMQAMQQLPLQAEDQQMLQQIETHYKTFHEASDKVLTTFKSNRTLAIQIHFGEERNSRKTLDPLVDQFLQNKDQELRTQVAALNQQNTRTDVLLLSIAVLSVLLGLIFAIFLIRSIVKPLQAVNEQLKEIADGEGDLTKEINLSSTDEVGQLAQSFNRMNQKLRTLIRQVNTSAEQVSAMAEELTARAGQNSEITEQIASTIQQVAEGSFSQVQSVEANHRSLNEVSSGVQQIAANAQHVSASVLETSKITADGNQDIQTAIRQMESINDKIGRLAELIKHLGERSVEVGQISSVITGIASRTNLLALNAAIEAARAGEHGRGFAIVADEVRKLAEQSSASASQISDLILAIQTETQEAIDSMDTGIQEVASGIQVVHSAGASFEQIFSAVSSVAEQMSEVSAAVQQISAMTEDVVDSVGMIAAVAETTSQSTQDVAAAAEEQSASTDDIASSARKLSNLAEELQTLIGKFQV